jgi:hypothetical protein
MSAATAKKGDTAPPADALEDDDEFEEFEAEWNPLAAGVTTGSGSGGGTGTGTGGGANTLTGTGSVPGIDGVPLPPPGSARDWQDDWDDERVDDEFGKRLRAELARGK